MLTWIVVYFPLTFASIRFLVSKVDSRQTYADMALWLVYFGLGLFSFALVFLLLHDVVWITTFHMSKLAKIGKAARKNRTKTSVINTGRRVFMSNSVNAGIVQPLPLRPAPRWQYN